MWQLGSKYLRSISCEFLQATCLHCRLVLSRDRLLVARGQPQMLQEEATCQDDKAYEPNLSSSKFHLTQIGAVWGCLTQLPFWFPHKQSTSSASLHLDNCYRRRAASSGVRTQQTGATLCKKHPVPCSPVEGLS